MTKVSIIVPVYNAEKYLFRCVDSILNQTFKDFELLLIDDGSTDKSGEICDGYTEKDNRIRVFHKENGGVSSARNVGLNNAKGEWIAFVDADDMLFTYSLEFMIGKVSEKVDLVICGYNIYNEKGKETFSTAIKPRNEYISLNDGIKIMFADYYYNGYLFNKLFKYSIIQKNKLLFSENIYYNEDRLFCVKYILSLNQKIYYSSEPIYMYMQHADSAIFSLSKSFSYKIISEFDAYIAMYKILRNRTDIMIQNKELAKEGMVGSYRRLKRVILNFELKDEKKIISDMRDKLFQTISLIDYLVIILKFLFRSMKRRVLF